jgi:hypothetical protein
MRAPRIAFSDGPHDKSGRGLSMSDAPAVTSGPDPAQRARKSFGERASFWVGVLGSLVTVVLTLWNGYTKQQIDRREEDLKALELTLQERSTGVEESRERVDRYKWVLSLFTDLGSTDERKRNFALSLVRLALTKEEANNCSPVFNPHRMPDCA